ncbi:MAG: transposase [Candidatus Aminicenantes bacterium]|nr:transposase [Candidatus Aminicenantes bacterium]
MARQLRIEFPGTLYHITHRGNEKKPVFLDTDDRECFLDVFGVVIDRFGWNCHSYVLMDNHYHLLVETPGGNLSKGMMQLNSTYTQKFNRKHNRVGHLFQGRFKSILVEKDVYLLELSRYIVLNPVRASLVENITDWNWSSFPAMIGNVPCPGFLTIDWLLGQFSAKKKKAIALYTKFVQAGAGINFPNDELIGQSILGSSKFINEINRYFGEIKLDAIKKEQEFTKKQRFTLETELEAIFQKGIRKDLPRNQLIYKVYYNYNVTMKEIGEYLGMHYATISRIIKREEMNQKKS